MNRARFAKLNADTVEAGFSRVHVHDLTLEGSNYLAHGELELDDGSNRQFISHLEGCPLQVQFQGPPETVYEGVFFSRIYIDKVQRADPDSFSAFWFLRHIDLPNNNCTLFAFKKQ